ncbi:MAG: YhbY family RNA-binding protein [Methanomicrobiales archaeon]|nr:YhbY family RNA-binding protein [Methanomicrobiales archaeon]
MKEKASPGDLKPTVWIGKKGCSEVVYEEIQRQIKTKKILKVRFLRSAEMNPEELAARTNTILRRVRGRTVILEQMKE